MESFVEERLRNLLAQSALSVDEQGQFIAILRSLDDAHALTALDIFETEPQLISTVWDIANEKLAVLNGTADPAQVVKEEIDALKQ